MKRMTEKQIAAHMKTVESRRLMLEQGVQSVTGRFTSALFVYGPGGLGKSHLLKENLKNLSDKGWRHHTGHSTPKALFLSLLDSPDAIHLYEDCEPMLKVALTTSILRAACGAPNDDVRRVTYEAQGEDLKFDFRGGIIMATNQNLARSNGPMQAVASRFRPILWDMTLEERIASIITIARKDHVKATIPISAKEAEKVAWTLIDMTCDSSSKVDLDLRLFTEHALPAYAQSIQDPTMKWQDLMQAKLMGVAITTEETQAEKTRRLEQLVQKIDMEGGTMKDKLAKWAKATDLGKAIYYRHLKSVKKGKGK
jgi:hypothetical protein